MWALRHCLCPCVCVCTSMCLCMFVWEYVSLSDQPWGFVCTVMHVHVNTCIHLRMHERIYVYGCLCRYFHSWVCNLGHHVLVQLLTYLNIYGYMSIQLHVFFSRMCVCMHVSMFTCIMLGLLCVVFPIVCLCVHLKCKFCEVGAVHIYSIILKHRSFSLTYHWCGRN